MQPVPVRNLADAHAGNQRLRNNPTPLPLLAIVDVPSSHQQIHSPNGRKTALNLSSYPNLPTNSRKPDVVDQAIVWKVGAAHRLLRFIVANGSTADYWLREGLMGHLLFPTKLNRLLLEGFPSLHCTNDVIEGT